MYSYIAPPYHCHLFNTDSLNDVVFNRLNRVQKNDHTAISFFTGYGVFDGYLMFVILSNIVTPTRGMAMPGSRTTESNILHMQKDVLISFP